MPKPIASDNAGSVRKYWDSRFVTWAMVAAIADLATKQLAVSFLTGREIDVSGRFGLLLVWNTGGAGGYSLGPTTWYLNVLMTAMAVVIMSVIAADLGRFHRLGAIALGVVTGGAIGNLASMLVGPKGVADFLAVHFTDRSIIFNVADIALWTGASMLVPVVVLLVRAIRAERAEKSRRSVIATA